MIETEHDPDRGTTTVTSKMKMTPKVSALDSIARHLGMFNDTKTLVHKLPPVADLTSEEAAKLSSELDDEY